MTKWFAVCDVCMVFSVPAMAAQILGVTVPPTTIETPVPTPKLQVKFAEAKSYYGYSGVGYGSYGLYPERRVSV